MKKVKYKFYIKRSQIYFLHTQEKNITFLYDKVLKIVKM